MKDIEISQPCHANAPDIENYEHWQSI